MKMASAVSQWAKEIGYEFDGSAEPTTPAATLAAKVNGQLLRFRNHGVFEDGDKWSFDGKAHLDLPKHAAPKVAGGKTIRITATVQAESPNGVIFAHGGDKSGYSVYLKEYKLSFATCVDWNRTVITAKELFGDKPQLVEAVWKADGEMQLKIGKQFVAQGKSIGPMKSQPADSAQIGADTITPVGDYRFDNYFRGTISGFAMKHDP